MTTFTEKFGVFKATAATKVINVDDLKFIKLGYFSSGRAFIQTNKNGMYCLDTSGNIVKQWEGGNILRFFAPNFKSISLSRAKWGFIDKTGQVVSEKYKNCITPFFGGHAVWTKVHHRRHQSLQAGPFHVEWRKILAVFFGYSQNNSYLCSRKQGNVPRLRLLVP